MPLIPILIAAWGQSPALPPEVAAWADYEVISIGEGALHQARWDVVIALKRQGWDPVEKGKTTVFKPPRRWMGRARLDEEGNLSFGYPVVRFRKAKLYETEEVGPSNTHFQRSPGSLTLTDGATGGRTSTLPAGQAGLWVLPSRRILDSVYGRARAEVQDEIDVYQRIQRDTALAEQLADLPDRLDALWLRGESLMGLPDRAPGRERVEDLLQYWGTRSDDPEGGHVTRAIEAWMRAHRDELTITAEQRMHAESNRGDRRVLRF